MTGKWKTIQDYHEVAARRGFECLIDELPLTTKVGVQWRCELGHIWKATFNHIDQGYGCPFCYGNNPKTLEDYQTLAEKRGFECLISETVGTHDKVRWRCKTGGHEWNATYHNVKSRNSGCPFCAHCAPLTAGDYALLAERRNFIWCGEFPKHTLKTTTWQCSKGHTWKATYNTIAKGEGCPDCFDMVNGHLVSRPQRELHKMVGGELNFPAGTYRIDVALEVKGVKIGIEYDVAVWHRDQEQQDAKRDAYLVSQGWRMLHVKTKRKLPNRKQLNDAIQELVLGMTYAEIVLPDWGK